MLLMNTLRTRMARTWLQRFALWAVVAIACAAWVGQIGHMTLVSHSYCTVHDQLVHGPLEHAEHAEHDSAESAESASGETTEQASVSAEDDHEHEHCTAVAADGEQEEAQALFQLVRWQHRTVVSERPGLILPHRHLFLLAPKNSPPASA